ncbi:MAG: cation-translocating P-type ATPase [Anaerolineaceae bacterium]|nr:cation-translocating P-type ATPase [Anaerolineaceae bacterium]
MTQSTNTNSESLPEELSVSWHALSTDDALKVLETQPLAGLSSEEAALRLNRYGPNQLASQPRSGFLKLLAEQLKSFIVILLLVAALVSAVLGEWVDAAAIFTIVLLNATLGIVQESRAEDAMAALKKLAAPEAQVLRDGHRVSTPASQLVPGDVVFLETGNFIPADLRLLEAVNLKIEEAALTGESLSVQKDAALLLEKDIPLGDRKNTAFSGTTVIYGRGVGLVVSTGMHTQLGLIANMLESVETEQTPLQKHLDTLGRSLGWGALAICGLIFIMEALRTNGSLQELVGVFMIAVSLAIAAVPEGLPAVVTISLALGMREMVRRHALIRRLAAVETLGSATIICTDKTGTLTQNEMTVTRLWVDGHNFEVTGAGYLPQGEYKLDGQPVKLEEYPAALTALWVGILNNDASLEQGSEEGTLRMVGDPTEGALLVAAAKTGAVSQKVTDAYPRANEIPFDSERKRMLTVHAIQDPHPADISPVNDVQKREWFAIAVKGAPDVVLELCNQFQGIEDEPKPMDTATRRRILDANDQMTRQALRVLGLAYRLVPEMPADIDSEMLEKDLVFAGLVGMIDPARPEVKPALEKARKAGIRTLMITGDYPNTAQAIAESIGLLVSGHKVMTGSQINHLDDSSLREEVRCTDVFARVSPEHKLRIVEALRANHEVVAMTGDGVNDAPAIKRADIGVTMGITGSDVAKETADMVLTDDNYASIVSAIEQGRIIYSNIRKFVYYLLSCNLGEIGVIFLATLFGWPSPLTAIQLLWLNLVTDGAPALALAAEKGDPDTMIRPPRPSSEPIINRSMRIGIIIQTIAIMTTTLLAFYIGRFTDPQHVQFAETMAFVTLSCSELLRAYTSRSEYYPLLKIGVFENRWMNYAFLSSLILILAVVYIPFLRVVFNTEPLGWAQWSVMLPLLLIPSVAAEVSKVFMRPAQKSSIL